MFIVYVNKFSIVYVYIHHQLDTDRHLSYALLTSLDRIIINGYRCSEDLCRAQSRISLAHNSFAYQNKTTRQTAFPHCTVLDWCPA